MSTRVQAPSVPMRKAPKQARSRATVGVIVDAGARVLSNSGWAGFTTNKVAEAAGVSIGSLYQYFPDKTSLVSALRQKHLDDCLATLRRLQTAELPKDKLVRQLVQGMIAVHDTYPGLHRVLLEDAPDERTGRLDPHSAYEKEYLGHYASAVALYRPSATRAEVKKMAVIISDAIDGVIHNAARRRALKESALVAELVRLVQAYLEA
jgi:AcrR family transcriptional regulator